MMFSGSIYQTLNLQILQKRGLLISEIPDLQVYTIKTLLIGRFFLGPKNRPIRGVPVPT